ncbi:GNAT family N-acetyltransferase [Rheinheimera muenzenbergensis]|uniref:GNAT family N-acetyltransferase n=1 Tax=Rheinheimera muenzenbergensis TaxID=1193628 RepID=A0ABU8CBL1_9GAMM
MVILPAADQFYFQVKDLSVIPLSEEHGNFYTQIYRDGKLMKHIATPLSQDKAHQSFILALKLTAAVPAKRLFLVIQAPQVGGYAGLLCVSTVPSQPNCVEVGIMLMQQFHRSGLAQTALATLCHKVFSLIPSVTIIGRIDPHNAAAKKLVAKLGFVYCNKIGCYNLFAGTFQFQEKHRGS